MTAEPDNAATHGPILTPKMLAARWHVCPETIQRLCLEYEHNRAKYLGFRVARLWRIHLDRMRFWEHNLRPTLEEEKIVDIADVRK